MLLPPHERPSASRQLGAGELIARRLIDRAGEGGGQALFWPVSERRCSCCTRFRPSLSYMASRSRSARRFSGVAGGLSAGGSGGVVGNAALLLTLLAVGQNTAVRPALFLLTDYYGIRDSRWRESRRTGGCMRRFCCWAPGDWFSSGERCSKAAAQRGSASTAWPGTSTSSPSAG
jgi:hypothetical protein